jgi:hypothetical protein
MNVEDTYTIVSIKDKYKGETLEIVKLFNIIKAIFTSIFSLFFLLLRTITMKPSKLVLLDLHSQSTFKGNSKGLYVIIHGLFDNPYNCSLNIGRDIDFLNNKYKTNFDILIPNVPYQGNCSLKDASNPILHIIIKYIEKYPYNSIHLIGSSNGARIASFIEIKLRSLCPKIPIRITSISGIYFGTSLMNFFGLKTIFKNIFHKDILEDFQIGSKTSIDLIDKMQYNDESYYRYYEFYGSANDLKIPNIYSCFPKLNSNQNNQTNFKVVYHPLIEGSDHDLLGNYFMGYFRKKIIIDSIGWMKRKPRFSFRNFPKI